MVSEGVLFNMGSTKDEENNVLNCAGQTIAIPKGDYNKVYLLASAAGEVKGDFLVGSQPIKIAIQNWTGFVRAILQPQIHPKWERSRKY